MMVIWIQNAVRGREECIFPTSWQIEICQAFSLAAPYLCRREGRMPRPFFSRDPLAHFLPFLALHFHCLTLVGPGFFSLSHTNSFTHQLWPLRFIVMLMPEKSIWNTNLIVTVPCLKTWMGTDWPENPGPVFREHTGFSHLVPVSLCNLLFCPLPFFILFIFFVFDCYQPIILISSIEKEDCFPCIIWHANSQRYTSCLYVKLVIMTVVKNISIYWTFLIQYTWRNT